MKKTNDTGATDKNADIAMPDCSHLNSSAFSGDLVCVACGRVLQSNSQLSLDQPYLDRDLNRPLAAPSGPHKLSHQERGELELKLLARKVVAAFALRPAHETEALALLHRYWADTGSKHKYGLSGSRLLVAAVFLLARRDHLAVNLGLLAASIDSSAQDCGAFFDPLVRIDPGLRSLARVSDYAARAVDLVVSQLHRLHGLQIVEAHLHGLRRAAQSIAELLQDTESGSSKSAEATALAASSLALAALLLRDRQPIDLDSAVLPHICEASNVSLKMVAIKRSALVEKLMGRAAELLPSMFSIKMTRQRKLNLLLANLDSLIPREETSRDVM